MLRYVELTHYRLALIDDVLEHPDFPASLLRFNIQP